MDLIKPDQSLEQLPNIFSKHGFNRQFSSDIFGNFRILEEKALELDFKLPNSREGFFTLFHNLGSAECDAAYLYDVASTPIAVNDNPKLENIIGLAKDLTRTIIGNNLIVFYERDRFAIPKISLYREGEIVRKSVYAGEEKYSEDYWRGDEEKMRERGKKTLDLLRGVFREVMGP